MKIAIIGTGIAGNVAAYKLRQNHDMTVFESGNYVGGHTNTVDVHEENRPFAVDTGFIVFNDRTYPNFIQLLEEIGQDSQPSEMSFSVQDESESLGHYLLKNGYSHEFVEFYLVYCESAFIERAIGDVQLLIMRPGARREQVCY